MEGKITQSDIDFAFNVDGHQRQLIKKLLLRVEKLEQQVKSVDLADVGEYNSSLIWEAMTDENISQETYEKLGSIYNELCSSVNKNNWPIRININYV